ncbi:uncharacterized protein cubi_03584 [Cryptosporidium ubiquitum]|uniref:Uncharacterized protein n=1 Tax=Cryptosporidium ubiquitum TaxID=857276 RepID=A0A1J4MHP6_9CRYT|nr:uncharacterized protein cubi_03584 [Cryptosporidium ubiquitum]OII73786.1 hypothetical protein cubi_03584 [Cryptosporidium ubiquitum]
MSNLKISTTIIINIILILVIAQITHIVGKGIDVTLKGEEVAYNRQNGLNRLVSLVNSLTTDELKVFVNKQEYVFSSYLDSESQVNSLNNDDFEYKDRIPKKSHMGFEKVCHIPIETKSLISFSEHSQTKLIEDGQIQNYFFPRVKHYKKNLPELTPEPYQRVMGFAIEVCMLPSVWYLELVHCMYVAMSPYFDGMLMSYSLQDLVGSAIISMEYKNERFSKENCIKYLPLFSDDKISSRFKEICREAESCLESRSFYTNKFSNFKNEFNQRIQEVYSSISPLEGALDPKTFARYSILYSLSILSKKLSLNKVFPERNFLPIRVMAASVGYYALVKKLKTNFLSENHLVSFFTKLISNLLFEKTDTVIEQCSSEIIRFFDITNAHSFELFRAFCKEVFSVGFINESYQSLGEINSIFINSTHPKRILLNSYASVVPEMIQELPLSEYSNSWMNFKNAHDKSLDYIQEFSRNNSSDSSNVEIVGDNVQEPISDKNTNSVKKSKKFSKKKKKSKLCFRSSKKKRKVCNKRKKKNSNNIKYISNPIYDS